MEDEESKNSTALVVVALALFGVLAVGGPLAGVAGLALMTDMQGSASACSPSTVVSDEGSEAGAINVPNGWGPLVEEAAKAAGIPASVAAAQLQQESQWNPNAGSSAGAQGIAQFMPDTWAAYGKGGDVTDPEDAISAYGRYMAAVKKQVEPLADGDANKLVRLALAAYNAGPGAVLQHGGIPPYAETTNYVEKITRAAQLGYSPDCQPVGGEFIGELGTGEWTNPLPGGRFTSVFGVRPCPAGVPSCNEYVTDHAGIDLAGGGTVVAPTDMVIRSAADSMPGHEYMGTYVLGTMAEEPKLNFQFHHCAPGSLRVATGDTVAVGTPLCTEGASGNASGTHLHFQITTPDAPGDVPSREHAVDPSPILAQKGIIL